MLDMYGLAAYHISEWRRETLGSSGAAAWYAAWYEEQPVAPPGILRRAARCLAALWRRHHSEKPPSRCVQSVSGSPQPAIPTPGPVMSVKAPSTTVGS